MDEPTCQSCIYFYQHFTLDESRCTAVKCGHCRYPRLKHRKPDTKACIHYIAREKDPEYPDRDRVINYLTTDLLDYFSNLVLPPEVKL